MTSVSIDLDEELASDDLRATIRRLQGQLHKAHASKEELVSAVYQAATDGIRGLEIAKVDPPKKDTRRKTAEVAVPWMSDWQLAKVTPSYNSAVCEERIAKYAQKVLELTEIQRADHPVRDAHVILTGDLVEGELIFPGQSFLIDASLYDQVCVTGPRILTNFLRTMLSNFERVHVTAVIGNHGALGGRSRRDYNPESNADRMLYRITQGLLANEKRLTWTIPDGGLERNWYAIAEIGNYRALCIHGDQFRGGSGMPWYSLQKKVGGWALGAIEETFNEVLFGHYHQPTRLTLNTVTARCSGSTESHNTYAQEQLAAVGQPSQNLLFVHPDRGMVSAEYCVWLND